MGSADPVAVARVADELLSRPPSLATARLLAIDGPAGSGKSTLARAVERVLSGRGVRTDVLGLDAMYAGWTGLDDTLEPRVLDQVLRPLVAGREARWLSYDWNVNEFRDWHNLPLPDVLVLEGCGAGARAYAAYTTLLVWVETTVERRTERAIARDGVELLDNWAAWSVLEQRCFELNRTRERAEIRITT
jgi:uridine kinase